jgi:hypothetical protein
MKGFVLGVLAAATLALAAGIAYAAIPDTNTKVFTACMLKGVGTIRLIDPSVGGKCASIEQQVSWNQQGQAGVSPTVTQLAAHDANCPAGGAAITDAAGSTAYVCSGKDGQDGQDGQDGADFAGSFTSPNGQSKLNVDDTGIKLEATTVQVKGSATTTVEGQGQLALKGGLVQINGPGGCLPAARIGDTVQTFIPAAVQVFPGGLFFGTILTGSPTVCIGG